MNFFLGVFFYFLLTFGIFGFLLVIFLDSAMFFFFVFGFLPKMFLGFILKCFGFLPEMS